MLNNFNVEMVCVFLKELSAIFSLLLHCIAIDKRMMKVLLTAFFVGLITFAQPCQASVMSAVEIVDNNFQQIAVSYSSSVLRITGAEGEFLQIYNVAGIRVMNVRVESADKRFEINLPKGCYIIKIGKYVRKISVK